MVAAIATIAMGVPAAHGASAPVRLAGTTIIHGAKAAYVDVRVPKAVTLATPFGGGDDLSVAGASALAAFVMVGADARTSGVTIAGGETNVNGHARTFLMPVPQWPMLGGGTYEDTKTFADTTPLPAGTYRLYVLSSGPATFVLRLRGLPGSRSVRPVRPARGSVVPAGHELSATPVKENVFAATDEARLARPGFALQALQSRLETEAAWQVVMCHQDPSGMAAPLREAPGCPGGEKHTFVNHRYPGIEPDDKLFVQAYAGLPAGEHALSTVYTSESRATAIGYAAVWLEYEPA